MTGPQLDNRRVLAALIDLLLLVPVAILMSMLFGGFTSAAAALTLGWGLYYYFALESDHGQTIGKRVMKLRVARADGQPLDIGRVAVRTLLRPIDAIGAYLVGLVVMMATGQRRQRIGDLAAGTVVTDASAPDAAAPEAAEAKVPAAPVPAAPVIEAPVIDAPPMPAPSEPEPDQVVDAEPPSLPELPPLPELPQREPEPAPEVDAPSAPSPEEIVPVDRPENAERPTDEPVPVPQPEAEEGREDPKPSSMEIVSSPIDLVMEDHDEEPKPPQA